MKRIYIAFLAVVASAIVVSAQEAKKEAAQPKKDKTAQEYIADLSSSNEDTAVEAANWLGQKEEKAAVPELVKTVKNDGRPRVRMFAVVALGLIADEGSVEALNETLLNDSSADVRYSAILAISRIGSTKSIDTLKQAREKETDPYIKDYIEKMAAKVEKK
jgi:HEAT repeat protein